MNIAIILLGGAGGACCRYLLQQYCAAKVWQINLASSVAIGAVVAFYITRGIYAMDRTIIELVFIAFLAGFSTVSGQVNEVWQNHNSWAVRLSLLLWLVLIGGAFGWVGFAVASLWI